MSVMKCIRGKVAAGKLTDAQAAEIEDRVRRFEEKNRRGMNEEQAQALAAKQAMDSLTKEKATKARQTNLRLVRQADLLKSKDIYGGNGYRWLLSEMDIDPWAGNKGVPVSNLQEIHRNNAFAMMNDLLTKYRPRLAGLRRPRAGMDDVVRELHGQATGIEAAKELAEGFRGAAKYVWSEFNRAAGDTIAWREDWALPHVHDPVRVGSVTAEQWADEVMPLLNRDRMLDFESGQPLSDAELYGLLTKMHDNISTHGLNDATPGMVGGRSIANRRSDPRMLQFKDGDAWLAYSDKYGAADPLDSMVAYVQSMSRDIGLMDKFGPNPKAMVETLKDTIKIADARKGAPQGRIDYIKRQWNEKTLAGAVDRTYAHLSGAAGIPENSFIAGIFSATRAILSSAMLQSSTLSAITDLNGQRLAYRMMGIEPMRAVLRTLPNIVRNLTHALPDTQQLALHLGLGADSWTQTASGAARYTGDVTGPEWSRRLVDFTMRSILLTPWTQGGKNVLALDFYHLLAQNSGKAFKDLPADLSSEMGRFGIGEDYWNVIRKAELHIADNGAKYVNPLTVAQAEGLGLEASVRLQNMMLTLQRTGIIEVSARTKAGSVAGQQPGTVTGEVMRSFTLFKSFPLTQMHMQLFNAVSSRPGGLKNQLGMLASVMIGATAYGMLSTQLREMILNGRDPLSMDPSTPEGRKAWGMAAIRGGGFGVFDQFMFQDVNHFGKGVAESFAGPIFDVFDDAVRLTMGNIQDAATGEKMKFKKEAWDLIKKYMPAGKEWYAKLALERTVLDQLDTMADPKAYQRFSRQQRQYWKERHQRYWWGRGKSAPQRAPNLEAATGQ